MAKPNDKVNDAAVEQVRKAAEIVVKQEIGEEGAKGFQLTKEQMYLLETELQLRGDEFLVPLVVAMPDDDIDDEEKFPSPCYILGAQGLMMKEQSTFYTSITPVKDAGIFAEVKPRVDLHFPKLPRRLFLQGVKFLKKSFDRFQGESIVVFLYRPLTEEDLAEKQKEYGEGAELPAGEYICIPPTQEVSHAGVEYNIREDEEIQVLIADRWRIVGDMHSHADFGAFHSGTDDADEFRNYPGFHITIGDFDKPKHSFCARFVIGDWADKLEQSDIIEDEEEPMPDHWDDKIGKKLWGTGTVRHWGGGYSPHSSQSHRAGGWQPVDEWRQGEPYQGKFNEVRGWWFRSKFFPGADKPSKAEFEAGHRVGQERHSQGGQKKT